MIAVGKAKVGIQAAVLLGTQPFFPQVFQLYLHLSMSSDSNLAFTPTGKSISLSACRTAVPKKNQYAVGGGIYTVAYSRATLLAERLITSGVSTTKIQTQPASQAGAQII